MVSSEAGKITGGNGLGEREMWSIITTAFQSFCKLVTMAGFSLVV